MSDFRQAYVHTTTDMYHFDNEKEFLEFLKSDKAKEIKSITLSEEMTVQEALRALT